ncbi:uncharacterized protein LOC126972916 [Leptidea sinapis]|uniref:uncharacterized protein LOC126972916 n=1 Tax=Leptidea sinapis TaxID=189913 RepID=UPI002132A55B|nr:uncharacterized protein LOC126972916 [Leptidea sinapis]XP_050675986.1 uncharacterized protein LOC126972916 [Leptidea sinapis]
MWPLIFILITSALADNCSHIFNDRNYTKSAILTIKGLPTNLVYNPKSKDLLFTLIDLETLQNQEVQTKMDQYVLRYGEPIKIDNINGQSAAVDVKNNIVYIASDNGLNILNKTDRAIHIGYKDDIVQIFKPQNSDDIYAVLFPDNEVYKLDLINEEKERIENIPCAFIIAIDDNGNIFYECEAKYVKVLLKGFQESIEFVGLPKNSARAVSMDDNNRVILASNDGLYWLKPDNMIPKKLMDLDYVPAGIAFNGDNFYISTTEMIYEYNPCI